MPLVARKYNHKFLNVFSRLNTIRVNTKVIKQQTFAFIYFCSNGFYERVSIPDNNAFLEHPQGSLEDSTIKTSEMEPRDSTLRML